VNGTQIAAKHPNGGIEPLEGGESINEEQVPRMVKTDVTSFMSQDRRIAFFVITAIHHYKNHPTEWSHISITGHTDNGAIILRMLFAFTYQRYYPEQRP
jgi:hypothetical protein